MKKVISFLLIVNSLGFSLTLNDAIDKVKNNNLDVLNSQYDIDMLNKDLNIIKSKYYGKLDFTTNAIRSNNSGNVFGFKLSSREASFADFGLSEYNPMGSDPLNVEPSDLNFPDYSNFFETKLTYKIPIYTGGILTNYSLITKKALEIKKLDKQKVLNEKIFELKKSFNNFYFIDSAFNQMRLIKQNVDKFVSTVKKFEELGYAKKVDVLEVETKQLEVLRIIDNLENNKELIKHYISFLINEKVDFISFDFKENNVLTDFDLEDNLDILKVKHALDIKQKMLLVKKGEFLPKIGFFAEVSSSNTEQVFNELNENKAYTFGLSLTWNIFNGGSDYNLVEKEKIEVLKMKNNLLNAKSGIKLKLEQISSEVKNLDKQIDKLNLEFNKNGLIFKNYLKRFSEKLVSINEVLIKQSDMIESYIKLNETHVLKSNKILEFEKIINKNIGDKL